MAEKEDKENVINMAEARRRQQTLRKGASKNTRGSNNNSSKGKTIGGFTIVSWLQFGLFLAFMAYFMQQCKR